MITRRYAAVSALLFLLGALLSLGFTTASAKSKVHRLKLDSPLLMGTMTGEFVNLNTGDHVTTTIDMSNEANGGNFGVRLDNVYTLNGTVADPNGATMIRAGIGSKTTGNVFLYADSDKPVLSFDFRNAQLTGTQIAQGQLTPVILFNHADPPSAPNPPKSPVENEIGKIFGGIGQGVGKWIGDQVRGAPSHPRKLSSSAQLTATPQPLLHFQVSGLFLIDANKTPVYKSFMVPLEKNAVNPRCALPQYKPVRGLVNVLIVAASKESVSGAMASSSLGGVTASYHFAGDRVGFGLTPEHHDTFSLNFRAKAGDVTPYSVSLPGEVNWKEWRSIPVNWAALKLLNRTSQELGKQPALWPGFNSLAEAPFCLLSTFDRYRTLLLFPKTKPLPQPFREEAGKGNTSLLYRGPVWGAWANSYYIFVLDAALTRKMRAGIAEKMNKEHGVSRGFTTSVSGTSMAFVWAHQMPAVTALQETTLDDAAIDTAAIMAHEGFHVFQKASAWPLSKQTFPSSPYRLMEKQVENAPEYKAAVDSLIKAILQEEKSAKVIHLRDFVQKRRAVLARLKPEERKMLIRFETVEGTATYIGEKMRVRGRGATGKPFKERLEDEYGTNSASDSDYPFIYQCGFLACLYLDQAEPGWKEKVNKAADLITLLEKHAAAAK